MTVKTETNFWKSVKRLLENGEEKYLISRIESYVTPGFPDCVIFHNVTGFFTLELKIVQANNRIRISPLQTAWNKWYAGYGAPVFILVNLPKAQGGSRVKLFSGAVAQDLREKDVDSVPGLYEGRLKDLDFLKLPNSVFNK
jgi:hypothetical protein